MGRPKRILQDELPYHVTTRTVHELKGFNPSVRQLNTDFHTVLAAEWQRNNRPKRKSALSRFAKKIVDMLITPSGRSRGKGKTSRRYDHEKVVRKAHYERQLQKQKRTQTKKGKGKKSGKKHQNKRTNGSKRSGGSISNKPQKQSTPKPIVKKVRRKPSEEGAFKNVSRYIVMYIIVLALQEILSMGFELYHFVLMDNHYHMIGKATRETIDKVMHKFNLFIAKQMNQLLGRKGRFFAERYKSNIVGTDELGGVLLRYVYQNPVRARIVIKPEDHDMTTYRVYVKGAEFLVDLSGECPIIQYLCPDKSSQAKFVKELVRGSLPPELAARLKYALRRHVVWMTAETYESLSPELQAAIKEHYIKLDESLKRYDLYSHI